MKHWRSLLSGFGSVAALFPMAKPLRHRKSVKDAIAGDWLAVGNDLRRAMGKSSVSPDNAAGPPARSVADDGSEGSRSG